VTAGSFLQRAQFFVSQENAFARRIKPGNRAFSIPVDASGRSRSSSLRAPGSM
jgi:hypothetical protein